MGQLGWIQFGLTTLIVLLGAAMNYGAFKRRLDEHDEKFDEIDRDQKDQDNRLNAHGTDIGRLQGRLGMTRTF